MNKIGGLAFLLLTALADPVPDHSRVPGVVVDYSPAAKKTYIGSPGLAVLSNGEYVASHDFFGPGCPRDTTVVFASADRGQTWTKRATIKGQWWSSLFVHRGALYLLGTSHEYGHAVIRRSTDGGRTWTAPTDKNHGLLHDDGPYHTAPVPVVVHNGRIWRPMEDGMGPGAWGTRFRAFMMSAPEDADLLKADNWTSSNRIARDEKLLNGQFGGWLEGNAVVTLDGRVVNVLRAHYHDRMEKAAVIDYTADGRQATFDSEKGFIDFPGGSKKFTIRYDPVGKCYWSLANWVPPRHAARATEKIRNTLALVRSANLGDWEVRCVVLHHDDPAKHAFQYVDWLIDGADMIALVRTAHDDGVGGAHNQHDANYLTFHRIKAFRTLTPAESVVDMKWLAKAKQ